VQLGNANEPHAHNSSSAKSLAHEISPAKGWESAIVSLIGSKRVARLESVYGKGLALLVRGDDQNAALTEKVGRSEGGHQITPQKIQTIVNELGTEVAACSILPDYEQVKRWAGKVRDLNGFAGALWEEEYDEGLKKVSGLVECMKQVQGKLGQATTVNGLAKSHVQAEVLRLAGYVDYCVREAELMTSVDLPISERRQSIRKLLDSELAKP